MDEQNFIINDGLMWEGILKTGTTKSPEQIRPIFEAITNSFEAIQMRRESGVDFNAYIVIQLYFNPTTDGDANQFVQAVVKDNGIGFDDKNFTRFTRYKDTTKGINNRGSGRLQFVHFFKMSEYTSTYQEPGEDTVRLRKFSISKIPEFLSHNAIIREDFKGVAQNQASESLETSICMRELIGKKDQKFYDKLTIKELKEKIISHYLIKLCGLKEKMPRIVIEHYLVKNLKDSTSIELADIPMPDWNNVFISVPMCKMSDDLKRIEKTDTVIPIQVLPYRLSDSSLRKNEIKITSKDEVIDAVRIKVTCIAPEEIVDNKRYLFLLKSDYFDNLEGDIRGDIKILDKTEFKKAAKEKEGNIDDQIILNDITDGVNEKAKSLYKEMEDNAQKHNEMIEHLKRTYLLSDEALKDVDINDSPLEALQKAYIYDAKIMASADVDYTTQLEKLDTRSESYKEDLKKIVDNVVNGTTLRDRTALSRYVTHRRLVIELLEKILERRTDSQLTPGSRNEDERLIHNLIFQQHSDNPGESDMWLLNEEYLYFKGCSEARLVDVTIDGNKLFREEITEEEERYFKSLGHDRMTRRPDILLFPDEAKCIIIEFKNPEVDLSLHLNQINKYAYFLRNFTNKEFVIDTFYGYLIGETIEKRDVRAADGDFKAAPKLEYFFRPKKTIPDDTGEPARDGELYTEILQFSVLKERAKRRNDAFIERLFPKKENVEEVYIESKDEVETNDSMPKEIIDKLMQSPRSVEISFSE